MDKLFKNIPQYLLSVMTRLEQNGFEAYLVGGCVRDTLMGRLPDDYDITTSASPLEVCRVFSDCRIIETGIKHGTVTLCLDGGTTEVTTYRIDGDYHDSRRPDSVSFTESITEDLARRDFTVNAMAYSPKRGLCDPFGGRRDLARRVIACVGEPEKRFSEDALRIMRAVRFASTLGFSVCDSTAAAALSAAPTLVGISRERILTELLKLLVGDGVARVADSFAPILAQAVPPLAEQVFKLGAPVLGELPRDAVLRLAYLVCLTGAPDVTGSAVAPGAVAPDATARECAASLKMSNADRARLVALCEHAWNALPEDDVGIRRMMRDCREGAGELIPSIAVLHASLTHTDCSDFLRRYEAVRQLSPCVHVSSLAIGGRDVLQLSSFRGHAVGEALSALLDRVIDGTLENTREELTAALCEMARDCESGK